MSATIAVADLGSNTFRLVTAQLEGENAIRLVDLRQRVVRLAEGVKASGVIGEEALSRAGECLGEFGRFLDSTGVCARFAAVTAAGRMAENSGDIMRLAASSLGAEVVMPTGEEEALLSFRGALSLCPDAAGRTLFLDIGGGSTEIVLSAGGDPLWAESVKAGIVTFWEENFAAGAATPEEILGAAGALAARFPAPARVGGDISQFIATAGTAMTLAALVTGRSIGEGRSLSGVRVTRREAEEWLHRLCAMEAVERLSLPAIERGREELILGAIAIMLKLMERYGLDSFTASDGGLADGLLLEKFALIHSISPRWVF